MDLMFESSANDREMFGITFEDHKNLMAYLNLLSFPLYMIFGMLRGERLEGFLNLYNPGNIFTAVFNQDLSTVIILMVLIVIFIAKPLVSY